MSAATDIHAGNPTAADWIEGDGWQASLSLAYAQIIEGAATCEHCDAAAKVVIATGADPDYVPHCWEHARAMIDAGRLIGDSTHGEG